MSDYTTSVSRPGLKTFAGTDARELMLYEFGQMTLQAWEQAQDFKDFGFTKSIKGAISDKFPVIGRKRDAAEHTPGELILGGSVEHNEVIITVDNMMVDSIFLAEIDELLLHYSVREAYSRQLGESLGASRSRKMANLLALCGRQAVLGATGHVTPLRIGSATMKTSGAKLEAAYYRAVQHIKENDVGGGEIKSFLPWAQQLLLAQYAAIDNVDTSGSGDRSQGTVGAIAGLTTKGTNWIPQTDMSSDVTIPSKYRGDFSATAGFIANQMAIGILNAKALSVVMSKQVDRLGEIMIASELYGGGILRPECSVELTTAVTGTNVVSID